MRCPQCQFVNLEGARFCQQCGVPLAIACASCAAELPAGARFCVACGAAVNAPVRQSAPRVYKQGHPGDDGVRSRGVPEGERKQVTVLFADVKGSMELAEHLDPEEWSRIMANFFRILSEGVERFEGFVDKFTGDGIMALFGAPIAHENHAQRACFAALHLRDTLRDYAEKLRREEGLNFSVRMGMNSGEVVVGRIGDDMRMDYTAQGHTVGLAARMETLAAADKCYLTEHAAALVADYFALRDLGVFRVKGVSDPLHVFELEGVGTHRTRLDVSRSRGLSRFVGRDAELASLEAALERTRSGMPQVVGVVAEAGSGKSRLFYEFVERCKSRGLRVSTGHCVAHGSMIPFYPVLELLRDYFAIDDGDTPQRAREKIAGRLLLLDEKLAPSLSLLFEFLGVPDPERPAPSMDPEPRRRMLYGALRRILECGGGSQPVIVVLEDLHWIDGASSAFIDDMIRVLPQTCCMMLLNYRPEYQAPWTARADFDEIALEPLGEAAIAALLADLLGDDASVQPLARNIERTTAGNPFFVEELVHALVEAGSLEGPRGAYRLVKPVKDILLPPTVHAVLAARIDHLPECHKEVLQTAAVVGKQFPEAVLARLVAVEATALHAALQALCASGFLYQREVYPQAQYAFEHPLTQEVAYRTQLSEKRRLMHGATARVLSELEPERLVENAALLAHHWEAAGELLEAASAGRRAAEWTSSSEIQESRRHWLKVMDLIERLPLSAQTLSLAIAAAEGMLALCWRLGLPHEEAERVYRWGESWAERGADKAARARLLGAYGSWHGFTGDLEASLTLYDEAASLLDGSSDIRLRMTLHSRRAYSSLLAGKLRLALQLSREVVATMEDSGSPATVPTGDAIFLMGFTSLPLTYLGRLQESRSIFERALALAIEGGEMGTANSLRGFGITNAWFTGDAARAMTLASPQVDYAERIASPAARIGAYDSLGIAHLLSGAWGEAVDALETALSIARETGTFLQAEALVLSNMAEAYRGKGELDRAVAAAEEAVAVARARRTVMHECRASLLLGRVLLCRGAAGDSDGAAASLAEALVIVERTEAKAYEPYVRRELATLSRARGDAAKWRDEMLVAARLFGEIGASERAAEISAAAAL